MNPKPASMFAFSRPSCKTDARCSPLPEPRVTRTLVRGSDLAIFPGIGTPSFCRLLCVELDAAVIKEAGEPVPMVQAVTDGFGDQGLARDARELLFEPPFGLEHERLALLLAPQGTTLAGSMPPDRLLDRIERRDALEGFACDRSGAVLGDIEEPASQVGPVESERDRLAACCVGNALVGGISVALHDAAIVLVRWIVGFAAGGSPDIIARLIGQWLSERLGQQFVIENRPGAGKQYRHGGRGARPLGTYVASLFKSRRRLEAENLFLRHQLNMRIFA